MNNVRFRYGLGVARSAAVWAAVLLSAAGGVGWSQDAFDDEGIEESAAFRQAAWEASFAEAMEQLASGDLRRSVKEIKRLASDGHARSQFMLGLFFRYGTGVRQSDRRSAQWLEEAAAQRFPLAMLGFAEALVAGDGTRRDAERARELLEPLARKEWDFPFPMEDFGVVRSSRAQACTMLGGLLIDGEGGEREIERGLELMRFASQTGSAYASLYLLMQYAEGEHVERDIEQARRYFELADLQSFDSVRRGFEGYLVELVDPVVRAELEETARNLSVAYTEQLLISLTKLAEAFLGEGNAEPDPAFAAALLRIAAEGGNGRAQNAIGRLHWEGVGVASDREAAFEWFERSAETGWRMGRYHFALLSLERGGEADAARRTLDELAELGLFSAQLALDGEEAGVLTNAEDVALARSYAAAGDARAEYAILKREDRGWGVEHVNREGKLFREYRKVARDGYHRAQYEVGSRIYSGDGTKQSYEKALQWLEPSAEQGNASANFRLGYMYDEGQGVEVDAKRAAAYYAAAVAAGDRAAANNLANFYIAGTGVELDLKRGFELYHMAAEKGDRVAAYNLGWKYLEGVGVEPDEEAGLKWLTESAEAGYERAIQRLLKHYDPRAEGFDAVEYAYWTEKHAESGNRGAKKDLAFFYHRGLGVPKSEMKAYSWIVAYLTAGPSYKFRIRDELLAAERKQAIEDFMPVDYEAYLLYVELLMTEGWMGHDPKAALEAAERFRRTGLFAGRMLLAQLWLDADFEGARPLNGVGVLEEVYADAMKNERFVAHAAKASLALARLYARGEVVDADRRKRDEWIGKSAATGYQLARYLKAAWDFVEGDAEGRAAAAEALRELSESGYARATYFLAEQTRAGATVPVEREALVARLRQLHEAGQERARGLLEALDVEMEAIPEEEPSAEPVPDRYAPSVLG